MTGVATLASASTIGDIEISDGQIQTTAVGNNLSFNDNNLSTTGTLSVDGLTTFSEDVTIDNSKSLLIDKGATHQIILNSDVEDDNTPADASIAVALSNVPAYATLTWTNATSTWAISNNASVATDLTVGQDLIVTRNLYISDTATNGITFRHDEANGSDEVLLRVDRGATHATLAWDESSTYFNIDQGLNVVGAISQGARDGASNLTISANGVITSDSDGHQLAGLSFSGTTIEAVANGAGISFGDEDIATTGDVGGTTLTITGDSSLDTVTLSGLLTANGGISADGGVFTVDDVNGNVHTSGTLDADGDLTVGANFTVTANSGNTSVGGTLEVTSTITATAQGSQIADFTFNNGSITSASNTIDFGDEDLTTTGDVSGTDVTSTGTATLATVNVSGATTITNATFIVEDNTNADKFTVDASGNTTIEGTTTLKGDLNLYSSSGGVTFRSETGAGADGDANLLSIVKGNEGTAILSWTAGTDTLGFTDNLSVTGTTSLTGTTTMGTVNVSGLLSADGGIDVDGVFTVLDTTGDLTTSGTADLGATTVDSLNVSNNNIEAVGTISLDAIQKASDANDFDILLAVGQQNSLSVEDTNADQYQAFDTRVGNEKVVFGKLITAPNNSTLGGLSFSGTTIEAVNDGDGIDFGNEDVSTTGSLSSIGLSVGDGNITNVADISLNTISSSGATTQVLMDDNQAGSFEVLEGATSYIKVDTTDGSELITFGENVQFNGTASFTGGSIGLDGGDIVVNESGNANDFRVEGDTQTHLLFTDGSADRVGINNATPSVQLDVVGDTLITGATSLDGSVTINETGVDADFRVEGNGEANALFVQGSDGAVGINNGAPTKTLDVTGTVGISDKATLSGSIDLTTASTEGITFRSEVAENGANADQDLLSVNIGGTDGGGNPNYSTIAWANSRFEVESGLKSSGDFRVGSDVFTIVSASGNTEVSGVISVKSADLAQNPDAQTAIVLLNSDATANGTERDAIIEVERGVLANSYLQWDESEDEWLVSNGLNSAGNLTVGANVFTVASGTGNTSVGGTLGVTSTITATAEGSQIADFTFSNGSITSASNTIDFGDENLTTTGSITCTNMTVNGTLTTINSTDLEVTDSVIRLNKGAGQAENNTRDIGIFMERGSDEDDAIFFFDEDDSIFKLGLTQTVSTDTDFTDPTTWGALKIGTLATTSTITSTGVINANGGVAIDTTSFVVDGATYKLSTTGEVQVTKTSANALLVEDGAGSDIFNINTSAGNQAVTITTATLEPNAGIDVGASVFSVSSAGVTSILNTLNVTKTSTTALVVENDAGIDVLNVDTANSVVSVTGQIKTNDLRALTADGGGDDFKIRLEDNVTNALEILDDTSGDSFITFTTTTGSELIAIDQNTTFSADAVFQGEISIESTNANGIVFNSELSGEEAEAGDINLIQIERGTTGTDGIIKWDEANEEFNVNSDTHFQGVLTFGGADSTASSVTLDGANGDITLDKITLNEIGDNAGNGVLFNLADTQATALVFQQGANEVYITLDTQALDITLHQATELLSTLDVTGITTLDSTLSVSGITTLSDTLKLDKSVASTGIVFNSDRAVGDVINGADFDATLLHVENGGSDSVDAFLNWDDSEGSFTVDGGKLHINTDFSVGTNIGTQNLTISTTGAVDSASTITASSHVKTELGTIQIDTPSAGAITFNSDNTAELDAHDFGLTVVRPTAGTNAVFFWDESANVWQFNDAGNVQIQNSLVVDSDQANEVVISAGSITTANNSGFDFGSDALTTTGDVSTTGGGTLTVAGATTLQDTLGVSGVATFSNNLNVVTTASLLFNSDGSGVVSADTTLFTVEGGTDKTDVVFAWDTSDDALNLNAQAQLHLQGLVGSNAFSSGGADVANATAVLTTAGALTLDSTLTTPTLSVDVIEDKSADGLFVQLADNQSNGFVIRQGTGNVGDVGTEYYITLTSTNGNEGITLHQDTSITGALTVSGNISGTGAHVKFNDGLLFLGNGNLFSSQKDLGLHFQYSDNTFNDKFFGGVIYKPGSTVGGQGGVYKVFHGYDTVDLSGGTSLTVTVPDADLAPLDAQMVRGGEASGQDQNGADLTVSGGLGTGTGTGGSIVFEVSPAGASSSSSNAGENALTIDSTKKAVFEGEVDINRSGTDYAVITAKASEGARYECATVASGATLTAPDAIENKHAYFIDNGANAGSITLFALNGTTYNGYVLQIINQGTNTITVNGNDVQTINGDASVDLNVDGSVSLIAFGTSWYIL